MNCTRSTTRGWTARPTTAERSSDSSRTAPTASSTLSCKNSKDQPHAYSRTNTHNTQHTTHTRHGSVTLIDAIRLWAVLEKFLKDVMKVKSSMQDSAVQCITHATFDQIGNEAPQLFGASLSPSWPSQQPPKLERLSPRHRPRSAVGKDKDKGKDTSILFPPLGSETPHTPIGTPPTVAGAALSSGIRVGQMGPTRDVKAEKSEKAAPVLVKEAVQEREVVVGKAKEKEQKEEQKAEPPVKKDELTQQKEEAPKKTETETPAVVVQQQQVQVQQVQQVQQIQQQQEVQGEAVTVVPLTPPTTVKTTAAGKKTREPDAEASIPSTPGAARLVAKTSPSATAKTSPALPKMPSPPSPKARSSTADTPIPKQVPSGGVADGVAAAKEGVLNRAATEHEGKKPIDSLFDDTPNATPFVVGSGGVGALARTSALVWMWVWKRASRSRCSKCSSNRGRRRSSKKDLERS